MVQRILNKALKHELIEKNITQRELAARAGISEPVLSCIARGIYIPSPEQIKKIADVLRCHANKIFNKE